MTAQPDQPQYPCGYSFSPPAYVHGALARDRRVRGHRDGGEGVCPRHALRAGACGAIRRERRRRRRRWRATSRGFDVELRHPHQVWQWRGTERDRQLLHRGAGAYKGLFRSDMEWGYTASDFLANADRPGWAAAAEAKRCAADARIGNNATAKPTAADDRSQSAWDRQRRYGLASSTPPVCDLTISEISKR